MKIQHTKPLFIKPLSLMTLLAASIALTACGGGGGGGESSSTDQTNNSNSGSSGNTDTGNTNGTNTNTNGSSNSTNTALETNAKIAKNFVDALAIPAYKDFATKSSSLSGSIQLYCDAIGKANEAAALTAAQSAWLQLKNNWQGTQLYAVGPVAANNGNLANRIYTANPFNSATQTFIKNEVTKLKANKANQLADTVVNSARGLDALEYLLYSTQATADKKDYCNYAVVVANDVKRGADAIVTAWADKTTGRDAVLTPQTSNAVDLIQPFFDNVITVVDKNLKDADLATPLSLKSEGACTQAACPELVENKLSKTTYASIKANLETLNKLYTGNGGDGFSVYFTNNKMESQGTAFKTLITNATNAVTQTTSLYDQATAINTAKKNAACKTVSSTGKTSDADLKGCAAFYHIKQLSDDIKTGGFKAAVNLDLPTAAAGDGD